MQRYHSEAYCFTHTGIIYAYLADSNNTLQACDTSVQSGNSDIPRYILDEAESGLKTCEGDVTNVSHII